MGTSSHNGASVYKSTNPFDLPFDTGMEQGNMVSFISSILLHAVA